MRLFLWACLLSLSTYAKQRYTIRGYVRESGSQEQLIGVNVYLPRTVIGTTSNTYGFHLLTLPATDLPLARW